MGTQIEQVVDLVEKEKKKLEETRFRTSKTSAQILIIQEIVEVTEVRIVRELYQDGGHLTSYWPAIPNIFWPFGEKMT